MKKPCIAVVALASCLLGVGCTAMNTWQKEWEEGKTREQVAIRQERETLKVCLSDTEYPITYAVESNNDAAIVYIDHEGVERSTSVMAGHTWVFCFKAHAQNLKVEAIVPKMHFEPPRLSATIYYQGKVYQRDAKEGPTASHATVWGRID